MNRGFTLIELLIVIAIIGILAGTVVVSLTGETDDANDASVKLGVSALRTPATSEQLRATAPTGDDICDKVYYRVKAGKEDLETWDFSGSNEVQCDADDADQENEICCASDGREWVIWGNLTTNKYYCVDDDSFSGEASDVDLTSGSYDCTP